MLLPTDVTAACDEPTVLGTWTATVVRALHAQGLPGEELARAAGIEPTLLHDGGRRVPLSHSGRLWELAVAATGDPCFGVEVSRFVGPGTFHGLGVAILASATLAEALERISRFGPVVLDMPQTGSCGPNDGRFELRIRYGAPGDPPDAPRPADEGVEATLAATVRTLRFLTRRRLSPLEVALRRPRPPCADRFEAFFGCPVRYGSDEYLLAFDPVEVHRPLPTGCAEAALAADAAMDRYLSRAQARPSIVDEVRRAVVDLLGTGDPTPAAVAARLAMSERTLQRRLQESGTRYRDLVTEVRMRLAHQLLVAEQLTADQVAAQLAFSDTASFRRAFKRWTGTTPGRVAGRARSS